LDESIHDGNGNGNGGVARPMLATDEK
jgi:hypothetical protein